MIEHPPTLDKDQLEVLSAGHRAAALHQLVHGGDAYNRELAAACRKLATSIELDQNGERAGHWVTEDVTAVLLLALGRLDREALRRHTRALNKQLAPVVQALAPKGGDHG